MRSLFFIAERSIWTLPAKPLGYKRRKRNGCSWLQPFYRLIRWMERFVTNYALPLSYR